MNRTVGKRALMVAMATGVLLLLLALPSSRLAVADWPWSDPVTVAVLQEGSHAKNTIDVDAQGTVHLAWAETPYKGVHRIRYASRARDGSWSEPVTMPTGSGSAPPAIATSSEQVHLVWEAYSGIYYANRGPDGVWSDPALVVSADAGSLDIETDTMGRVHLLWSEFRGRYCVRYAVREAEGSWGTTVDLVPSGESGWDGRIAVDSSGGVHVVWVGLDYVADLRTVVYREKAAGWLDPVRIYQIGGIYEGGYLHKPDIAVAGDGTVHVVWPRSNSAFKIMYAARESGVWNAPLVISQTTSGNSPRIEVDNQGTAHASWWNMGDGERNYVLYASRRQGENWLEAINLTPDGWSYDPGIAVDSDGVVYVAWRNSPSGLLCSHCSSRCNDFSPPSSNIAPLPAYQGSSTFTVSWSGWDDRSGIVDYDIQFKDGAFGLWTDWIAHATETSATFTGEHAHTYYFQSRARDKYENIEAYPGGNGDASTTVDLIPPTGWVTIVPPGGTGAATGSSGSISGTGDYPYRIFLPLVFKGYPPPTLNVILLLAATDDASGVGYMLISNDPSFAGAAWEPYATSKPWRVNETGTTTVYVKYKDNAGNVSEVYSDAIDL